MSLNGRTRTVLYRSSRSWRTKRNFELFSADAFLAALCEHIPPKGFQTLRYYGYYSNKARGRRQKAGGVRPEGKNTTAPCPPPAAHRPSKARKRRRWRDRLLAIWGCDPFHCPCCGGSMRPRGTVQGSFKARTLLEPLGLWDPVILDKVAAPRAPPEKSRWAVDALDGTVITLERETDPRQMPDTRLPRQWDRRLPAGLDDQSKASTADCPITLDDQLVLVIDDPDPWAHETEPIFWSD